MLSTILSHLSSHLSDFLRNSFDLNEDIGYVYPLTASLASTPTNKIHLSLVNIERETSLGMQFSKKNASESYSQKGAPSWMLNIYVLFTAVFSEKRYDESLQLLSAAIVFLQKSNTFTVPKLEANLSIEPVNLSFNELSNLWSISGGCYYPSVLCKIRALNIDSEEIKRVRRLINQKEVTTHGR